MDQPKVGTPASLASAATAIASLKAMQLLERLLKLARVFSEARAELLHMFGEQPLQRRSNAQGEDRNRSIA